MAEKDTRPRGATIAMRDPRTIKVMPGLNARDMESADTRAHVEAIAASIEAQGFLGSHPLETFFEGDTHYVAAGHCRLAAVMLLIGRGIDIPAIPCLSEARGTSQAQRLLNQITSNTGQRLNLAEEGKVYARLVAMGYTIQRIAKDAGRSDAHIRQALDFNAAPHEAHALVSEGKVSASLAAATIRKEGGEKGVAKLKAAVETAKATGKTKATAKHIDASPKAAKAAPAPASDPGPAAIRLAKRIAAMDDPRDMSAAETMKALIRLVSDAQAIFAAPIQEAAE